MEITNYVDYMRAELEQRYAAGKDRTLEVSPRNLERGTPARDLIRRVLERSQLANQTPLSPF